MGSILPPEHPAWEDPDIANKSFTTDGSQQALKLLNMEVNGVSSAEELAALSREDRIKTQIRAMEIEMNLFRDAYKDMSFVEVKPKIKEGGQIVYPRKKDFLNAWSDVARMSYDKRYFGVYYSGMSQVGTGNWVVLPDDEEESQTQVDFITLTTLLRLT